MTVMAEHDAVFFDPVIKEAADKGLDDVEDVTVYVLDRLLPGCKWPPQALADGLGPGDLLGEEARPVLVFMGVNFHVVIRLAQLGLPFGGDKL